MGARLARLKKKKNLFRTGQFSSLRSQLVLSTSVLCTHYVESAVAPSLHVVLMVSPHESDSADCFSGGHFFLSAHVPLSLKLGAIFHSEDGSC